MEIATYAAEAAIEADHWWFVGRRCLFAAVVKGFSLPPDAAILDLGSGTGANLRLLRDLGFARVKGVDFNAEAIRFCSEKGLGAVQPGDVCAAVRRLPIRSRLGDGRHRTCRGRSRGAARNPPRAAAGRSSVADGSGVPDPLGTARRGQSSSATIPAAAPRRAAACRRPHAATVFLFLLSIVPADPRGTPADAHPQDPARQ
jgi:hypothetical protein